MVARELMQEHGLVGWPKTTGSRGIHVYARIERRWGFDQVRCAAVAFAREVEQRVPQLATTKWWKEERHGVFLDYNQNAKDRTIAAAYSVRPNQAAQVSAPLAWDEVPDSERRILACVRCRRDSLNSATSPRAWMTPSAHSTRCWSCHNGYEAAGLGDAPWSPHYAKQAGEPRRVAPSRCRAAARDAGDRPTGRRALTMPLIVVAKAKQENDARAGLERWRARHA